MCVQAKLPQHRQHCADPSRGLSALCAELSTRHRSRATSDPSVQAGQLPSTASSRCRACEAEPVSTEDPPAKLSCWESNVIAAPLTPVSWRPLAIAGAGRFTSKGVDASLAGWLDFGEGFCTSVECSFEVPERQLLEFAGTGAAVSVERGFTPGPNDTGFDLRRLDGSATRVEGDGADPYLNMIEDFAAVVRGIGCPARTAGDAVALLEVADQLWRAAARHQVVS